MSESPVAVPRSVADVFAGVLAAAPDREALVTRSGRWTYAELDALADRAAHALVALDVRAGDRVAAALPNDVEVVAAFHGAMRVGAVWVGVNRALAPPEVQYLLADSGASLLLADGPAAEQLGAVDGCRVLTVTPEDPAGEWDRALAAVGDAAFAPAVDVDPDAPAGIAYTSGTTGYPKGAVHSQHNLVVPGAALVTSRGYGPGLRKGDCLPLTILNMQVLTTVLVAQAGGCCVIMDRVDAAGVAEWIRTERVSTWNGTPAILHSLAADNSIAPGDLASLDEVWVGGADCPEAIRSSFTAKFGVPVIATYGLSEAPTVVSIDGRDGAHADGASGRPLPHLDVRIVDDEVCVGARREGSWAGVYHPMLGYWQQADASAAAVVDGVLHTGDLGFLDDHGYLHIRERKSLVIIRGGANVYPAEVERVLHDVDGVVACAVMGVPDARLGERVVAAVQRAPGASLDADALTAHCLANLARYKVPERWVFVDGFPRNSMGKIQRRELRDLFD
jgi:acyl-CoA synthetase (AMP-forming)/AMP-acid ligase II